MAEFTGTVQRIIYADPDTSFYIFMFRDAESNRKYKAKGTFALDAPAPGKTLNLEGTWETHHKYGRTFVVSSSEVRVPTSIDGLVEYLSGYIKEIGPVLAQRLVDTFGEDTLDVLDNEPERLEEVPRIGAKIREEVATAWEAQRHYREVALALIRMDLPKSVIRTAYDRWGSEAVGKLQQDPYRIMEMGCSFFVADRVALKMGMPLDVPSRIAACVEFMLQDAENSGHLYVTFSMLKDGIKRLVRRDRITSFGRGLHDADYSQALRYLLDQDRIVTDGPRLYLKENYLFETKSVEYLHQLMQAESPMQEVDTQGFIASYETSHGMQFSEEQREAIVALSEHPVLIVTGGPGTGKTTVSRALVRMFQEANLRFALMSPTGIAAKRLSSVVNQPATTIHRILGYQGGSHWGQNEDAPLAVDAVLVDEFSMVDQELLYRLLSALRPGTVLVCVGDHAQLPSVGAGNVLHEMIKAGIPCVKLNKIFRQKETSDIVLAAHAINQGEPPRKDYKDFRFIGTEEPRKILEQTLTLVKKIQEQSERGVTFQALSPRWAGTLGVDNLNAQIREVLNPDKGQKSASVNKKMTFRVGDRVMIMSNDYVKGVFNGEQGTVVDIDTWEKEVHVRIRDEHTRLVPIPYSECLSLLKLAFCTTVHKSQGQEYDYVVLPFVDQFNIQLQRNLLYTAVTRAKKRVFLIGHWSAVEAAIRSNRVVFRNTKLSDRLVEVMGPVIS